MHFTVRFHGPFRVATGAAKGAGRLDVGVDPDQLLPASSLKGVMRAAARAQLGLPDDVVGEVFGDRRQPCPWAWTDAEVHDAVLTSRTRVSIDPDTGTARDGALVSAEEVWASEATFEVLALEPLDDQVRRRHHAVLAAAGHAVTSLGADRRRGFGWVSITASDPALDDSLLQSLVALQAPGGSDA